MAEQTETPQKQDKQPGIEAQMQSAPQYIKPGYRAAGKLKGKVALITGGDSGIGRAVSVHFAQEGADIAIVYLNEDEDAEKTKGIISALSPIVVTAITAWVTNRKNKRDAELEKAKLETERERIRMLYDLTKTKLILEKDNTTTIEITANELDELDKILPPHDENVKK